MSKYVTYPVVALPEPLRGFVSQVSKSIGCDPSFVALPMLSMLAASIGNSCCLIVKRGYAVPSILWTVIVCESGAAKSPALRAAKQPLENRQRNAFDRHRLAAEQYERDHAQWKQAMKDWKAEGSAGVPPAEPPAPRLERCKVSDITVEALAPLLLANPRGLFLERDELNGWLGSFNQYSNGKGSDSAHWLSMYNGESLTVDRKTGVPPTIYVPSAIVNITGSIQPATLRRALGVEHRENGLAARLLLASPPNQVSYWTEADIAPEVEAMLARVVDRLFELQPRIGQHNHAQPVPLGLTRAAKAMWVTYHDGLANEMTTTTGDLRAAMSKLRETPLRLALVLHLAQWAASEVTDPPSTVSPASMESGIALARWHAGEARRVYAMLDSDPAHQKLVDWIAARGGAVTATDVQRGYRSLKAAGTAEPALVALIDAGLGEWEEVPTTSSGGRPTRRFRLFAASTVNETPENIGDELGFVDVDTIDAGPDESRDAFSVFRDANDTDDGRADV